MNHSKFFNLETFEKYAKEHTAKECAEYFGAKIENTVYYGKKHNIKFKPREYKEKANSNYKHGKSGTRIYRIYNDMLKRCKDKNNSWYGKKGIKVEFSSFEDFYEWSLNNGYADNLSIDRIDSSKNYSKDNCRWVTAIVQSNNTSRNKHIFYENETHTIAEWSRIKNIPYSVLFHRLKLGWSLDKVFNTKVGYRCQK